MATLDTHLLLRCIFSTIRSISCLLLRAVNSYMFNCMQHPLILTRHAGVVFFFLQLRRLGKNIFWCQNLTFWTQAECWCRNDKYWFMFMYCNRIPFQVEETFSPDSHQIEVLRYSLLLFYPGDFFHHVVIIVKLYLFIFLKTCKNIYNAHIFWPLVSNLWIKRLIVEGEGA